MDTPVPSTPEPQKPTPKVRISKARTPTVRSAPSTKGQEIGTTKAGAEYELLDTDGKWYKIRLENGDEGWITGSMAEIID